MTLKQDPEIGCGYGAFKLPSDHPFSPLCRQHDLAYGAHIDGFPHRPLADADKAFLSAALGIAKEKKSVSLRIQAFLYFSLITAFRKLFRSDG